LLDGELAARREMTLDGALGLEHPIERLVIEWKAREHLFVLVHVTPHDVEQMQLGIVPVG